MCVGCGVGVRSQSYLSGDHNMTTHRHTEDSTPSDDLYTRPRKKLTKNAENVMFYHLRRVSALRTSMDFNRLHV